MRRFALAALLVLLLAPSAHPQTQPITDQTRGHATHMLAAIWGQPFSDFLAAIRR